MAKQKWKLAHAKKSALPPNSQQATTRKTAFIATEGGPERVLPREIRENIYRYLLVGHHVKKHRESAKWTTKGYAEYYDFQVNILRASKAIYAEAREILYRENAFAVLSTKEKVIGVRMGAHAVPVVSHNFHAVDRFSEHSLFMRFEGPVRGSLYGHKDVCGCPECTLPPKEERMLLHVNDLQAFVRVCRVIGHMDRKPTFTIIDSARDGELEYHRPSQSRQPCFAKIEFRANSSRSVSSGFVEGMLGQFRKVIGDRQVKILAPKNAKLTADTEKAMMPKVVWGYAVGWDLVEVMREMKADADEIVKRSSLERDQTDRLAFLLCDNILMFAGNSMIFHLRRSGKDSPTYSAPYCRPYPHNGRCLDWIESWFLVNLDLAIASSLLNQFSGSDKEASAHMEDAQRFMHFTCHAPPETAAHLFHVLAFIHAKKGECDEVISALEYARFHREMSELGPDSGLEQDYKKQIRHSTLCGTIRETKSPRICLCCSSFAGKTYVARDSAFAGSKPDGIIGWQDIHHQLSDEDFSTMALTKNDAPPRIRMQHCPPVCLHQPLEGERMNEDMMALASIMSTMGFAA